MGSSDNLCCRVMSALMAGLFALLFLGVMILGIIMVSKENMGLMFGVIIMILGIVGVVGGIFGVIGTFFRTETVKKVKKMFKVFCFIFFIIALGMQAFLLISGVIAFMSDGLTDMIKSLSGTEFGKSIMRYMGVSSAELNQHMKDMDEILNVIGVYNIVAGVAIIAGMIFVCFHYGLKMVNKFILLTVSVIELAFGILAIILAAALVMPNTKDLKSNYVIGITIMLFVLGGVMVVVGIIGIFSSTCCSKFCSRCGFGFFVVINLFVVVMLAAVLVFSIVIISQASNVKKNLCKDDSSILKVFNLTSCAPLQEGFCNINTCDSIVTEKKLGKMWGVGIESIAGIFIFTSAYLLVFFLLGVILSCGRCCCGMSLSSSSD